MPRSWGSPVQRATVKDVARRAGVSVGTASQAFNKPNAVSLESRQAVLQAAAELGYRPNPLARSLVARRRPSPRGGDAGRPRLITVGYLSIDFVVSVEGYPAAGERTTSHFIEKMIGGPAANVAAFAAGLGDPLPIRAEIVTRLGDDQDSIWAAEELARRGVDATGSQATPGERLSRCIVLVDGSGGRTIVNEPLQVPVDLVTRHLAEEDRAGATACIHFDGFHLEAAERAKETLHARGYLLSLHAAGLPAASQTVRCLGEWLDVFDLIFLDQATLGRIAATDPGRALLDHPERLFCPSRDVRCRAILLTRGPAGATLLRPGADPVTVPAPRVDVVDVTGAGDAFTGVFLGSFLTHSDPVAALGHAVAGASLSVTAYGAQGRLVSATEIAPAAPHAAWEAG